MPKISNRTHTITGEKRQLKLDFTVMYTQDHGFHVIVPEKWVQLCQVLSNRDRSLLHIDFKRGSDKVIVKGETESLAIDNFIATAKFLIDENVQERRVIMIFFEPTSGQYNNHKYNPEHPQLGALFGLTYAIEISAPEGSKQYCIEVQKRTWKNHAEPTMETVREYFNPWPCPMIDDTVENRANLESLYLTMKNTFTAVKSLIEKPELMALFLSSGTLQLPE